MGAGRPLRKSLFSPCLRTYLLSRGARVHLRFHDPAAALTCFHLLVDSLVRAGRGLLREECLQAGPVGREILDIVVAGFGDDHGAAEPGGYRGDQGI